MAGPQNRGNRHGNTNDNNRGKQDERKRTNMGKPERNDNRNDKGNNDTKPSMVKDDKKPEKRDHSQNMKDSSENPKDEVNQKSKFTGRCRLFVGNLPNDTSEDEFRKLFEPFGELSEVYVNTQRAFGFVRLDTRQNAENAKAQLDGLQKKGRSLRVRFATHGAALRVKHLSPYVSNELLESAFSQFGAVERAVVIVDDRGKPTGDGIVEFARKPGAQQALNRINDGVFLLGANPRPIIVEPLEQKDEEDGLPEKFILKNQQFHKEHEQPPRFGQHGTFECEFAQKWKDLYRMEAEQKRQVARQMEEAYQKLDMEMESAHIEHQAMLLRQDYLRKQEELKRMEEEMQQRLAMRRQEEDVRKQEEERRRQEMMIRQQQEEEIRRRQMERQQSRGNPDIDLFSGSQARQPRDLPRDMARGNDMRADMREEMGRNMRGGREMVRERNAPPMQPPPAPPAGLGLDRPSRQQGGMGGQGMNNQGGSGGGGGMSANMTAQNLRQSRFDQPPNSMGGGGGSSGGGGPGFGGNQNMGGGNMGGMGNNMGGGAGGNMMGNQNSMSNNHHGAQNMQGSNMGPGGRNMGGERNMGAERMMDRRREAPGPRGGGGDEFFENKRPRRF